MIEVRRTKLLGTGVTVYTAWEETENPAGAPFHVRHNTIRTCEEGRYLGQVGTADLPEELRRPPSASQERFERVRAWQQEEKLRAQRLIRVAYPHLDVAFRTFGQHPVRRGAEIETYYEVDAYPVSVRLSDAGEIIEGAYQEDVNLTY